MTTAGDNTDISKFTDYEQAYSSHAIPTPHVSYVDEAGWMQSQSAGGLVKSRVGSRRKVWNGTAAHTVGGLIKRDLVKNKWGRIVSRKKHETAKREKRLEKHGYFAKKGKFGYVRKITEKRRRR